MRNFEASQPGSRSPRTRLISLKVWEPQVCQDHLYGTDIGIVLARYIIDTKICILYLSVSYPPSARNIHIVSGYILIITYILIIIKYCTFLVLFTSLLTYFDQQACQCRVWCLGMGTVAIYYPTYGSRIWHMDTVPYEPLEELSTVWVAVRLIPYNSLYGSGRSGENTIDSQRIQESTFGIQSGQRYFGG